MNRRSARPFNFLAIIPGALVAYLATSCGGDDETTIIPPSEPPPPEATGALIAVSLDGRVGVLLDELPAELRDRAVQQLENERNFFWRERAQEQLRLANYRLVLRNYFYDDSEGKGKLPLPPESVWQIELTSIPARVEVDGHDLVVVDYRFTSTLLTGLDDVVAAEPALAETGGRWEEDFVFPLDPELLFQRTGYACADEEQFPPGSIDAENIGTLYDQECEGGDSACHVTEAVEEDCIAALERAVGTVASPLVLERLAWDPALADQVRVEEVTELEQAEVAVIGEGLANQRLIYRYIERDSCAVAEGCVGGAGWRRLLQFDASVKNLGGVALDIGDVDYYLEDTGTELGDHHVFEYSSCHEHYHFSHYGDFQFHAGSDVRGNKQAFCLQSTTRYSNNEHAPLDHPYGSCEYQGIEAGWGDDYGAGIECQWIDVTEAETGTGVNGTVAFEFNPDRFLCEGTPERDSEGHLVFEPSEFQTEDGETVDRPVCEFAADYESNNYQERPVNTPSDGLIATACTRGQLGPLRDCGFSAGSGPMAQLPCEVGSTVTLRCSLPADAAPVVLRVCEYSQQLETGVACVFRDAVVNEIVTAGETDLTIECPAARDSESEPGGRVSLYLAPVLPGDVIAGLECEPVTGQ
ncbi:MAG: lysyl oxidase family protein [Polyangiaceae bacterium]